MVRERMVRRRRKKSNLRILYIVEVAGKRQPNSHFFNGRRRKVLMRVEEALTEEDAGSGWVDEWLVAGPPPHGTVFKRSSLSHP